jgi:hypothetical protein
MALTLAHRVARERFGDLKALVRLGPRRVATDDRQIYAYVSAQTGASSALALTRGELRLARVLCQQRGRAPPRLIQTWLRAGAIEDGEWSGVTVCLLLLAAV